MTLAETSPDFQTMYHGSRAGKTYSSEKLTHMGFFCHCQCLLCLFILLHVSMPGFTTKAMGHIELIIPKELMKCLHQNSKAPASRKLTKFWCFFMVTYAF